MEILQEILVFITFAIAVGYIIIKFIWKPGFIFGTKKSSKACGDGCDSCH